MPDPQPNPALPDLLPCPFCGGEAEVERKGTARRSAIVFCEDCGARLESNESGAGRLWNERPDPRHDGNVTTTAQWEAFGRDQFKRQVSRAVTEVLRKLEAGR